MKISLKNLTKKFKELTAVDNLNIEIEEGSLVCLLGPSGCGKSTTLSMIAGLEKPIAGEIYFDEKCVNDIEAEYRDIGMVFQDYALYPHMTVMENIAFPLKMRKYKKEERIKSVKEVANILQIENLLDRKPAKLSGGQQQRVAIARALVKNPKILLLDEPLSNLDARLRIELREEIRNIQRKLQITTIFVTHDQEEALSISDKILLLDYGVMQQYSTPKEMYMEPKNKFVAGFLGNPPMNFMNATYRENKIFLLNNDEEVELFYKNIHIANNESVNECKVGIRPEDIIISSEGNGIEGEVVSLQTLGKEVYVNLKVCDNLLTACTNWETNYEVGEKVYIQAKRVHIFRIL